MNTDYLHDLERRIAMLEKQLATTGWVRLAGSRGRAGTDRLVATDGNDSHPDELIDKLEHKASFSSTQHQPVYGQVVADPNPDPASGPNNKLRLFTNLGGGEPPPPPPPTPALRGYVYSTISAAVGPRDAPIAPGTGIVRLYDPPASGPPGTAWTPGQNVPCESWMQSPSVFGKPVLVRESRRDGETIIYELVAEGCAELPSG